MNGSIEQLTDGEHGFHIHTYGDLNNGCLNAGSHFNPDNMMHGGQSDTIRHIGDLGNILAANGGIAIINITDSQIKLSGPLSIIGRSVVVHAMADDLGRGDTVVSSTTGNSGARVACGVIGIIN